MVQSRHSIPAAVPAFALAATLLLTGCASISESTGISSMFGSSKPEASDAVDDAYSRKPVCPQVEIRAEAESMQIYDKGMVRDASTIRYQAVIQRVARDCDIVGDDVTVRVGIAGRVAAGPKGGAGVVQVPLRVVVTDGAGKPIYSKAHIVPVNVEAPDFSALWSEVDDQVRIPSGVSREASIIVGLDELALKGGAVKPDAKAGASKKKS